MFLFEVLGLIICFVCVYFISKTGGVEDDPLVVTDGDEMVSSQDRWMFGIGLAVATSLGYAVNAIMNRALKEFHYVVIMTYHGMAGFALSVSLVLIIPLFNSSLVSYGAGITFFSYTQSQYIRMICACLFDTLAVNSMTVAFQSDSSGFISLVSYISIVYAFIGDVVIFNETFVPIELACSIGILAVIIGVSLMKLII
jgi:drug/metabolite transporter (DMT)-like permease